MENSKSPNNNYIISSNNKKIKAKIIFKYDQKIEISTPKFTLSDLKDEINKAYSIQENEYYLLIGENNITDLPNDTDINTLLAKYNEKKIVIKTFKNTIDIEKQLNDYENILSKQISIRNDEINLLKIEYEKIMQDLNNI
jgi:nicotinic acid mononucleotide adenylyltransferase